MKFKREEGELYSPLEEDVVAGRTPRQATIALKAKKVRSFIAKNPGCSSLQIKEALGSTAGLEWLLKRNLIRFENFNSHNYYVVPL